MVQATGYAEGIEPEKAMVRAVAAWQAQEKDQALIDFNVALVGDAEWDNLSWVKALYSPLVAQSIQGMQAERERRKQKTKIAAVPGPDTWRVVGKTKVPRNGLLGDHQPPVLTVGFTTQRHRTSSSHPRHGIAHYVPGANTSVLRSSLKERLPSWRSGNANHADHFPILRAELVRLIDNILLVSRGDNFVLPLLNLTSLRSV
jgi:hypothetical protein